MPEASVAAASDAQRMWFLLQMGAAVLVIVFTFAAFLAGRRANQLARTIAERDIAQAKESAALANSSAAEATLKAIEASNQTTALEAKLEEQRERAARAEAALLALRIEVAPRRLSEHDIRVLSDLLKEVEKGFKLVVSHVNDPEAAAYAKDFRKAFVEAGWKVEGTSVVMSASGREPTEFMLKVLDPTHPPAGALDFQEVLLAFGISAPFSKGADEANKVIFRVDSKPTTLRATR